MSDKVPRHTDLSLLSGPLYKDNSIPKDTSIKISCNDKDICTSEYNDAPIGSSEDPSQVTIPESRYDYLSLRNILREEMDKPITIEQAEQVGQALVDLFGALYFDEP